MKTKQSPCRLLVFIFSILWLPLFIWITSAACCSSADGDCSHTPPPTATTYIEVLSTEVTKPTEISLSEDGPWLLQVDKSGISARNQDSSALTQILDTEAFIPMDVNLYAGSAQQFNITTASIGGRAALVTIENIETLEGLDMYILTLPEATTEFITTLIAPEIEASNEILGSDREDFARKLLIGGPQWSPDGERLAFLAALDAPVFDLYVYDLSSQQTQRLTNSEYSPVGFSWSPDSNQLIFWGAAWLEPTLTGLGVVDAQGTGTPRLYQNLFPEAEGSFLGWTSPETYLLHSWNIAKGNHNLRQFNIQTGASQTLWPAVFSNIAFDPGLDHVGLCLNPDEAEFHGQTDAGVYLLDLEKPDPLKIADSCEGWIEWWPTLDSFLYGDGELYQLTLGGQTDMLSEDPVPSQLSPDGQWQCRLNYTDALPGLQIAALEGDWRDVHDTPIEMLKWRPDGKGLFYLDRQGMLLYAASPDFAPIELGQSIYFIDWLVSD